MFIDQYFDYFWFVGKTVGIKINKLSVGNSLCLNNNLEKNDSAHCTIIKHKQTILCFLNIKRIQFFHLVSK